MAPTKVSIEDLRPLGFLGGAQWAAGLQIQGL